MLGEDVFGLLDEPAVVSDDEDVPWQLDPRLDIVEVERFSHNLLEDKVLVKLFDDASDTTDGTADHAAVHGGVVGA